MGELPLQIRAPGFTRKFDALAPRVQNLIQTKIDEMARRLVDFPHERLRGRAEFRLRAGDFRVLYSFDLPKGRVYLLNVGHRREIYRM